jgi:F420-dependent oxidoreductase-like protein
MTRRREGVAVRVGLIVPQGWTGDYDGWEPRAAWLRTVEVAQLAERLGFESIWLFDHFHTVPKPTDELTFESFTSLSALAASTSRVQLGHIVICTAFRNPALTAKMISTMDVISGGRMVLGIGAGWKRDEWLAYGYGFPETRERLAALADHLEVITRMLEPGKGHATFEGTYAHVRDAINQPKPLQQPRVPIMVGGNGQNVTWRLAAKHGDELNVDGMSPDEVAAALPVIASRCEEIGRDPATLPVSVHLWARSPGVSTPGQQRVDLLGAYVRLGVSRVMTLMREAPQGDEAVEALAADARAAGVEMVEAVPA